MKNSFSLITRWPLTPDNGVRLHLFIIIVSKNEICQLSMQSIALSVRRMNLVHWVEVDKLFEVFVASILDRDEVLHVDTKSHAKALLDLDVGVLKFREDVLIGNL